MQACFFRKTCNAHVASMFVQKNMQRSCCKHVCLEKHATLMLQACLFRKTRNAHVASMFVWKKKRDAVIIGVRGVWAKPQNYSKTYSLYPPKNYSGPMLFFAIFTQIQFSVLAQPFLPSTDPATGPCNTIWCTIYTYILPPWQCVMPPITLQYNHLCIRP